MNCYFIKLVSYLLFALSTIITRLGESQPFTAALFNLGKGGNRKPYRTVPWLTRFSMLGGGG